MRLSFVRRVRARGADLAGAAALLVRPRPARSRRRLARASGGRLRAAQVPLDSILVRAGASREHGSRYAG